MKTSIRLMRAAVLLTAFVLAAAACGGSSANDRPAPLAPDSSEPASLPPDDASGDTPVISGACAVGEPDCKDAIAGGGDELPPPSTDDEPASDPGDNVVSSDGMLVSGGLSIPDALATDAVGVIAVQGFLFDDGAGARLCEVLAESLPPQCAGASISIENHEEMIAVPLSVAQGVTWSDGIVSFFGEIVDGTLVVDPSVAG